MMLISRINAFHHRLLTLFLRSGDVVVDCTVGNGHDSLFLLGETGEEGRLFGFDIQEEALARARRRLEDAGHPPSRFSLVRASHVDVADHVPPGIGAAVFNLGYLPGGDRAVVTEGSATTEAVAKCLGLLRPEGVVSITLYYGHQGGRDEAARVIGFADGLDHGTYKVLHLTYGNLPNEPPSILLIQKG
jgi:hypothetical protein